MIVDAPRAGYPRSVRFCNPEWGSSGIQIEYIKSRDTFVVSGWYDLMVGIEGGEVSRSELFTALNVPYD